MRISEEERQAIVQVLDIGKRYGYGNLISHLKSAWAKVMVETYGLSHDAAMRAGVGDAYPLRMHEDIVERGEWDETGKRYASQ